MGNPAIRLHAILTRSKSKELKNKNMVEGWRIVLGLDDNFDDLIVMSKVGKVFILPSIIASQIERFDDLPADLYLGWRNDLADAFRFVHFQANFNEYSHRLTDSLLINIRFCAHQLDLKMPERDVSPVDLEKIRESAWGLYEDVVKAQLSPELSRFLLNQLYAIVEAVDDYDITGGLVLERALNVIVGSVVTEASLAAEVQASVFGQPLWDLAGKIVVALKLATGSFELAEGVRKFFLQDK